MKRVYLGLGANLGSPKEQMAAAVQTLSHFPGIRVLAVSALYRSAPMDVPGSQPDYYNAVVGIETTLSPGELLDLGQALERKAGSPVKKKRAARRLDIDWLLFDDDVVEQPGLTIPHPAMATRAFVLFPLAEIAPDARHPQLGKTIAELSASMTVGQAERVLEAGVWTGMDKE